MEATGSSETFINFYKKMHHSSEDHSLNIYFSAGFGEESK
jgi:hypothetical protein